MYYRYVPPIEENKKIILTVEQLSEKDLNFWTHHTLTWQYSTK